jgi:hypothetical protein
VLVGELHEGVLERRALGGQLVQSEAGLCGDDVDVAAFHAGDGQALGPVGRDGGSLLAEQIEQRADLAEREPELTVTAASDCDRGQLRHVHYAPARIRYQATVSVIAVASGVAAVPKADSNLVVSRMKGSSNS